MLFPLPGQPETIVFELVLDRVQPCTMLDFGSFRVVYHDVISVLYAPRAPFLSFFGSETQNQSIGT